MPSPTHVAPEAATRFMPGWLLSILRLPLIAKLVGANVLVALIAFVAVGVWHGAVAPDRSLIIAFAVALLVALGVNVALVSVALRPLADLETTAERIWRGDTAARVPTSVLADRDLHRLGGTLNALLDGLSADRARLRDLASRVIRAGDDERSYIARELHDSSAQSLAALLMELSVAIQETSDPVVLERLERIRSVASGVLDEVRMLAQTVHPRVLDDLGLGAALRHLARETELRTAVTIEVDVESAASEVPASVASVLYRVAQEALLNALRHANATRVVLRAGMSDDVACVEIVDDGVGFRPDEAEARRPGMGLFTMRERVVLLDGSLELDSAPGRGTRVVARVPATLRAQQVVPPEPAAT